MDTPSQFWARVSLCTADECWEWQGAKTSSGYGSLLWGKATVVAHRVAYYLSKGGIDLATNFRVPGVAATSDQFVLHACDNRLCCNPAHLNLGTMSRNQKEAYARGGKAQPTGSSHVNSKLTTGQTAAIRTAYAAGAKQVVLAAQYGVSQRTISLVVRGETYKNG